MKRRKGAGAAASRAARRGSAPVRKKRIMREVELIDWIDAEQNDIRLPVGSTSYLARGNARRPGGAAESRVLQPDPPLANVSVDRVKEIHPPSHGNQLKVLRDGTELLMSRRCRDRWADSV
jgi:hypothetical protein